MNRSLLAIETSKTVIPGSCAVLRSRHQSCREGKGARASQMFDSHRLKLLSITSENIFPVVSDDCIEQGERGRSLGKDKSACTGLVERIAASRITKTTIAQCECVKIIDWKDWKGWIPDNRRLRCPLAIPLYYSACHSCYVSLAVRRVARLKRRRFAARFHLARSF
jgi:hypothetical protein